MTDVREAVHTLQTGGIVAFPTETVWSLSCSALDEESVAAVAALKGRPDGMPMAIGAHSWRAAQMWIQSTPLADRLARAHLPGPLSIVCKRRGDELAHVAPGRDTLSIRIPSHDDARRILDAAGPLVMTSCNPHGAPDPITAEDVRALYPDLLVVGDRVPGTASTIVDATGDEPIVLRHGALLLDQ